MADTLSSEALDLIFREARSYNGWLDKPVSDEQIHAIYELLKMAPTSANDELTMGLNTPFRGLDIFPQKNCVAESVGPF